MNSFVFENSTKVCFGPGCAREHLPGLLAQYGPNVLLAYGGGSVKASGIYDEIMGLLKQAGKQVTEFSGIMSNPTYTKVLEGVRLVKENQIDLILAVGGGSVMDCCKAVSMGAVYQGDLWTDYWENISPVTFDPLPLGVVVTLSGTGSEVNGDSVITHEEKHMKTGHDYPRCNPRFALLDPEYTYSVPMKPMLASGFDILSHIMEIYFSEPQGPNVSDEISQALMRSLIHSLRIAKTDPKNYDARSDIMWIAAMAENRILKLGKKLDFQCHQMEHQLGAYTNCSHGEGLAVLHPAYYRRIYKDGLEKFYAFAVQVWGISPEGKTREETALAGVEALADFIRELGLPTTLRELGVDDRLDLKAVADSCSIVSGSFRKLTRQEILDIFMECK